MTHFFPVILMYIAYCFPLSRPCDVQWCLVHRGLQHGPRQLLYKHRPAWCAMILVTEHQHAKSKSIIENPRFVTTSTLNHPVHCIHCMIHWWVLKCAAPSFPCMSGHPPRSRFRTRRSGKSSRRRCSTWHFRRMHIQNMAKWSPKIYKVPKMDEGNPTPKTAL